MGWIDVIKEESKVSALATDLLLKKPGKLVETHLSLWVVMGLISCVVIEEDKNEGI